MKFFFRPNSNSTKTRKAARGQVKGQAGLEYAMLLAVVLAALGILLYFTYQQTQFDNAVSQAQVTVTKIVDAVDLVYAQGQGARTQIRVYFPPNINYAAVQGKEVLINMFVLGGGTTDVYKVAEGSVAGSLPQTEGVYYLDVYVDETGTANIAVS